LLAAAPKLRILVTSRPSLRVSGELTWRVPTLEDAAAIRLFSERAAEVRPKFQAEGPTAVRIGRAAMQLERGQLAHSVRFLAEKWGSAQVAGRPLPRAFANRRNGDRRSDAH
jgi:predicted ATPase